MKILYFCLGITDSQLSGTEWKLCAFNIQNNNKKKTKRNTWKLFANYWPWKLINFFFFFTLFKVLLFALKHFIHTLHLTTQLSSLCLFISCFTFMFFFINIFFCFQLTVLARDTKMYAIYCQIIYTLQLVNHCWIFESTALIMVIFGCCCCLLINPRVFFFYVFLGWIFVFCEKRCMIVI